MPLEHEGIFFGREDKPVFADQLAGHAHIGYGVVTDQNITVSQIRGEQQQEDQSRLHAGAGQRRPHATSASR